MLYLPSPDTMFDIEFEGTSGSSACCLTGGIRRIRRLFSIALNNDVLDLLPLIFTRSSLADAISTFSVRSPCNTPKPVARNRRCDLQEGTVKAGNH